MTGVPATYADALRAAADLAERAERAEQAQARAEQTAREVRTAMADRPRLLTIDQTCAALRISRPTLYRLFRAGELTYVQIGSRRRVTRSELERLIRDRKAAASEVST